MKRLTLLLPLSLLACATTGTDDSEEHNGSVRSNHQDDHSQQHHHEEGVKDDRCMWQQPRKVMRTIGVLPGMVIADVGAGDGYFTFRLAWQVGGAGRVYANDIDRAALKKIEERRERERVGNIITILGDEHDPRLPHSALDMVLMVNVFHLLDDEVEFLKAIQRTLKVNGTLVLVQWDALKLESEAPQGYTVAASDRVLFSSDRLVRVVESAGYRLDQFDSSLSMQNIFIFRPKGPPENRTTQESRTLGIEPR